MWIVWTVAVLLAALLIAAYVCYCMAFAVDKRKLQNPRELLPGEQYEALREEISAQVETALPIPYEDVGVTSADGYRLHGAYYEAKPGAPLEIQVHGYRSIAIRDFAGGLQNSLTTGHNVLLIDQRAHGKSEGRCLTFGILEREDVLSWIAYSCDRFGDDCKIVLVGVSMGAATVMMAAELALPKQVVGIVADSGYTSPKEIICNDIRARGLSPTLLYPLLRLGAAVYGRFNLERCDAPSALSKATVPVLFIHGEDDRFVPCEMSRRCYEACGADKTLLTVPDAGHGLGFLIDNAGYTAALADFYKNVL